MDALNKAEALGIDALESDELHQLVVCRFISKFNTGGISGYFFNTPAAIGRAHAAVRSLEYFGHAELAKLLGRAAAIFQGYRESDAPRKWEDIVRSLDKSDELGAIDERMFALVEEL